MNSAQVTCTVLTGLLGRLKLCCNHYPQSFRKLLQTTPLNNTLGKQFVLTSVTAARKRLRKQDYNFRLPFVNKKHLVLKLSNKMQKFVVRQYVLFSKMFGVVLTTKVNIKSFSYIKNNYKNTSFPLYFLVHVGFSQGRPSLEESAKRHLSSGEIQPFKRPRKVVFDKQEKGNDIINLTW